MARRPIAERDARRLLGGGPVVLLSTAWRGKYNVMPAVFVTQLSFDPPLIGVAVHPTRHTYDMIEASEAFALNVPARELLHHTQYLGSVSGRDADKLDLTKVPAFRARRVDAPLLEGCVAYIECEVEDAFTVGDHTLFVGKVVAAQVEEDAFEDTWRLDDADLKPLHYLGLNQYALLGERLEARVPEPEEGDAGPGLEGAAQEASDRREREEEEQARESERR